MRRNDLPIVLAASLVFADATIVTLALPNLLVDLHTTVYGVAAVLAVYTGALGCTALLAHRLLRLAPFEWMGITALVLFSLASIVCALADRLSVLLVARALQGIAGALVLAVAGASLAPRAARAWVFVGVLSAAVGPVVGGALTQAFSWRSIFVAQVPIPLLAAMLRKTWSDALPPTDSMRRPVLRPILVLGLVSGALSALLFGVVLLLVVGWAMRPLSAALAVTLVPISALAGVLVRGHAETRVAAGCGLIGGGIGALAFLPSNAVGWLVLPECVAGFGMGLALAALIEHVPTERAKLRTVAVVLDAPISPGEKLRLAPMLVASVRSDHPLAAVRSDARTARRQVEPADRRRFDAMFDRVETVFVGAAGDAFHRAFLVAAALAFLAALLLVVDARRLALAVIAAGGAVIGAQALADHYAAPRAVAIADPCRPRQLPHTGGFGGAVQVVALRALDAAACRLGASREELVLALADKSEAQRFRRRHGVSPRSIGALLRLLGLREGS